MSPVDDTVRQIILEEFAKDKLQVTTDSEKSKSEEKYMM